MKRLLLKYFILPFSFIIVTACSLNSETMTEKDLDTDSKKDTESEVLEYTFENNNGQNFTIIRAYKLIEDYIKQVKDTDYSEEELSSLYDEIVLTPFTKTCVTPGSTTRIESVYQTPDKMELLELGSLIEKMKEKDVEGIMEKALLEASDMLPSDKQTVACLMPTNNILMGEGVSLSPGALIFFYKSNSPIVESNLKAIIAHEYMHANDPNFKTKHMLDQIIGEGKAVYFQKQLYPEDTYHKIYEDNLELSAYINDHLYVQDYYEAYGKINGWDGTFPKNFGYSEGYKIIKSLVEEEPELTLPEIIELNSESIITKSKYYEKLGLVSDVN